MLLMIGQVLIFIILAAFMLAMKLSALIQWFIISVYLISLKFFSHVDSETILFILCIYTVLMLPIAITPLRRKIISEPLLSWFRRSLPKMSQTEAEAIESGDTWWDSALFSGSPNWDNLLDIKNTELRDEEQAFLDEQTETLCKMLDDWQITHYDLDLPPKVWNYLKKERFFSMMIPKEYGGLGFSALANSSIVQKISSVSTSAAVTVMVPNSLGPAELLLHYGTKEQKEYYLPRLASAKEIPCFGLTSSEAGSDATSLTDSGIVCYGKYKGKQVLGMRLTWRKRYITLAPIATVLGLAVKLYDPDNLLGNKKELGITLCLLPTNHPGVNIGNRHFPLNQGFMNGPTEGSDVFVPIDWIIGGSAMVGKGWRMLVECLSAGRGISLPALAASAAKTTYRMTGIYASIRQQFRRPISDFGGVREAMATIAGFNYILEATRVLTVTGIDLGMKPAVVSAIAKYHMTEMARKASDCSMDVHGGRAIMMGPRNYIARGTQGIPISITVEGANILTRSLMIFGQGAIRCHPYVLREMQAAALLDEDKAINDFDEAFSLHVGFTLANIVKLAGSSLFGNLFGSVPTKDKANASYYKKLNHISLALSVTSDISLVILGGKLKLLERLSARLGDVLSYLYLASACLKYNHDAKDSCKNESYLNWAINWCLYNSQEALLDFLDNFPIRTTAWKLRRLIFPYGRKYDKPLDELEDKLVESMLEDSEFRDDITKHTFRSMEPNCPIGRMELAFEKLLTAKPLHKKIKRALKSGALKAQASYTDTLQEAVTKGLLKVEEMELLADTDKVCKDAIEVDDFPPGEL